MRRIESIEDEMRGRVTYELGDGRYLTLDVRDIQEYGLEPVMKSYGVEPPKGRLPVFQYGRKIGTVPASFEPMAVRSRSFLYDVRPGDFRRAPEGWEASRSLGPGDLDAVPDFIRDGEQEWHAQERMVEEGQEILGALTGSGRRE